MPQHLNIEVEGKLVGRLTTSNKDDTLYDITLCVPELGFDILLHDVNTGVQRQPQDAEARVKDYRNDFKHTRRCIAAAFVASCKLLQHLQVHNFTDYAEIKPIKMQLMTNQFNRGYIQVQPSDNETVSVKIVIGAEDNRVSGAYPKGKWVWTCEGIDISGIASQTGRALKVIHNIGKELLQALSEKEKQ